MEKLGLGLTESSSDQGDSQLPPAENRKRSLQRLVVVSSLDQWHSGVTRLLVHVCQRVYR